LIIYNGKNSEKDFDLFIASKEIPVPLRKEITETVPYMSGLWDFSFNENGEDEYEPVILKYTFDVIADTKQELTALKNELLLWAHTKTDGRLYDTDFPLSEYWEVYSAQAGWSEEGLQGLLTIEFKCYPLRKTEMREISLDLTETVQSVEINNDGFHSVMPIIEATGSAKITKDGKTYAIGAATYNGGVFTLERGKNTIEVTGSGTLKIKHWAEVL
jgi:phage-related protein